MTVVQKFVLAIVCALIAGLIGGLVANYLHDVYKVNRAEAFFIAGSAGYTATTLIEVFVDFMRKR